TVLYMVSMWASGITQGLMWQALDGSGRLLYPDFVETVMKIVPLYWGRAFGGSLFFAGFLLMLYNLYMTWKIAPATLPGVRREAPALPRRTTEVLVRDRALRVRAGTAAVFSVLAGLAVRAGSVGEILPALSVKEWVEFDPAVNPYRPLELAGRD